MVDYDRDIGGGVTLRIRDYGQLVEYWMKAGKSTYNYQLPWFWARDDGSASETFRFEKGGKWQRLTRFNIYTDQNVRFVVFDCGLGYPTYNFAQHINRLKAPIAPTRIFHVLVTDTTARLMFFYHGDDDASMLEWQVAYGTDPYNAQYYVAAYNNVDASGLTSKIADVWGLTSGTKYYSWARGRNAFGWGPWSPREEFTTDRIPDRPNPVRFKDLMQTSVTAWFNYDGRWDGGTPIIEWQIGYGLNPNAPTSFLFGTYSYNLTNLLVGGRYYFWSQARNAIGYSGWSARSQIDLVAGAYIPVGRVPHRAIPWVKVAGVWRIARPWTKVDGVWRTTQ
jgi:hypothetical protein